MNLLNIFTLLGVLLIADGVKYCPKNLNLKCDATKKYSSFDGTCSFYLFIYKYLI